ncbi:hypothetical protein HIM_02537 [Hirsutella minnesotensis 3608]|nr:hypothetical protein HIM_02537 [Hirsutella minnesotensis 3608]
MFFWHTRPSFKPEQDIPSLKGKVILVTGGNTGLGKQAIVEFCRHSPRQIWLAARDVEKAQATVSEIRQQISDAPVKALQMDLMSFDSVKQAAKTFCAEADRLDILMLNAGIMATDAGLTKEGYEVQFGVNHMGHALLTKLLMPILNKTAEEPDADVRVVSLASVAHSGCPKEGIVFESLKTDASDMATFMRYGQSKIANIFFAKQLAKLNPQLTVCSVHPGIVSTNLMSRASGVWAPTRFLVDNFYFTTPVYEGAKNQLWASVSKDVRSGEYYEPIGTTGKGIPISRSDDLAEKLWDWTEAELASHV